MFPLLKFYKKDPKKVKIKLNQLIMRTFKCKFRVLPKFTSWMTIKRISIVYQMELEAKHLLIKMVRCL